MKTLYPFLGCNKDLPVFMYYTEKVICSGFQRWNYTVSCFPHAFLSHNAEITLNYFLKLECILMAFAQALQISCSVTTRVRPSKSHARGTSLPPAAPLPALWASLSFHTLFKWHRYTHLRRWFLWLNQHTLVSKPSAAPCNFPLLKDWICCWEKPAWDFLSVVFPAVAAHRLLLYFKTAISRSL